MNSGNAFNQLYTSRDAKTNVLRDPGVSGSIIYLDGLDRGTLTLATAGTYTIDSATKHPLGTAVLILAQASVTVNSLSLADGEHAVFTITLDSAGAKQWVVTAFSTSISTTSLIDNQDLLVGTGEDAIGFVWSTGDASNHALVTGLADANAVWHIAAKADHAVDWNQAAKTDPQVQIHDATDPATKYLTLGALDGTTALVDFVGVTGTIAVDGTANVIFDGTNVVAQDNVGIALGTGSDIVATWDGTDLDITQATADSSIKWGVDGAGMDQVWYGDTASNSMTWDQSADDLIFTVAAGIVGAVGIVPFIPDAQQEDAPAPGAISVATYLTTITTEGAEAFSLANGGQKGQLKKIVLTVTAGDATLTITTPEDENTVVFSVVGDTVELLWNGAAWRIIAAYNQATGAITTPVLSTM